MCNLQGRYTGLKDCKIPTLNMQHTHKVSQFHKTLKQSSGPKLKELQVRSLLQCFLYWMRLFAYYFEKTK